MLKTNATHNITRADKHNIETLLTASLEKFTSQPSFYALQIADDLLSKVYHIKHDFYKSYILDIHNPVLEIYADGDKFKYTARIYKFGRAYMLEKLQSNIELAEFDVRLILQNLKEVYKANLGIVLTEQSCHIFNYNGEITIRWSLFYPAELQTKEKLQEYYGRQLKKIFDCDVEVSL